MVSHDKRRGALTALSRNGSLDKSSFANRHFSMKESSDMNIPHSPAKTMGSTCFKARRRHSLSANSMMRRRLLQREPTLSALFDDCYNSQTKAHLAKISDWGFDVFALDKSSKGRALFHVVLKLFQSHDLINKFQLDVIKLMGFATLVEEGYQNNPYHNAIHAADVAQAMHCYITQGKIQRSITPVEELVAIIAAITHDLDHPGVNQSYLIATNDHLANLYNNTAVLENHHFKMAVSALHQSHLLDHLPATLREKIEDEIKSLILATDMTRQQEFFTVLRERINENSIDLLDYQDRHFVLQIALKCADISNPCRHWSACKSWSKKVCDEFFRQGDYEREQGLKISFDRYSITVPKIQTGFIDHVVKPLFVEFERLMFPDRILSEQLDNLKHNRLQWQQIIEKDTPSMPALRPLTLPIQPAIEPQPSDIPSPTASIEESSDNEDDQDLEDCDQLIERRHSVPVLELLARSELLNRRQSFPDGNLLQPRRVLTHSQKLYQTLLLDQVVGTLTNFTSSVSCKPSPFNRSHSTHCPLQSTTKESNHSVCCS